MRAIGALADRMLAAVVPKTTAGACPCNDIYQQFCFCHRIHELAWYRTCRTNCDCSRTTCGDCHETSIGC